MARSDRRFVIVRPSEWSDAATLSTTATTASGMGVTNMQSAWLDDFTRWTVPASTMHFDIDQGADPQARPGRLRALVLAHTNVSPLRNLLKYSNDPSNAAWSKLNVTTPGFGVSSPHGTRGNVYRIDASGSGVQSHYLYQNYDVSAVSGLGPNYLDAIRVCLSGYFKVGNAGSNVQLNINDTTAHKVRALYDLAAGTVGTTSASGWSIVATAIEDASPPGGSGWYRCSLTADVASSTNGVLRADVRVYDGTTEAYDQAVTGARSVSCYNVSLEPLMPWETGPGPYQKTTTRRGALAVLRAATGQVSTSVSALFRQIGPAAAYGDLSTVDYRHVVILPATWQGFRWWRVDIYDPDNADGYLDAGRLIAGYGAPDTRGMEYEAEIGVVAETRRRGRHPLPAPRLREARISHNAAYNWDGRQDGATLQDLLEQVGSDAEVFYIHNTESTELEREAFYGTLQDLSPRSVAGRAGRDVQRLTVREYQEVVRK